MIEYGGIQRRSAEGKSETTLEVVQSMGAGHIYCNVERFK